jgi:hypothetical protein
VQKDFEAFIGQGEQAQGMSWKLAKEKTYLGYVKKKKERKEERKMSVWKIVF